ncbi:Transmembrane amino acid transporter protein [Novymonas esmeraldas]|uniref:Transmembrane amino acid transporter protein n=1 Tax=Novymonas esmeraldas TaxID=1808958 RepID=A0AAW0EPA2_9TRYP
MQAGTNNGGGSATDASHAAPPTAAISFRSSTPTRAGAGDDGAQQQQQQVLYSFRPASPPLGYLSRTSYEEDTTPPQTAAGASAAQRYFHTSPLRTTERDSHTNGFPRRTSPTDAAEEAAAAVPTVAARPAAQPWATEARDPAQPLASEAKGAEAQDAGLNRHRRHDSSDSDGGDGEARDRNGSIDRPRRAAGSDDDDEDLDGEHRRVPAAPLTAEEEQAARLRSYNEMAGGSGSADHDNADGAAAATAAASERGFVSDTLHTILPTAVTRWFSRSVDAVSQTSSRVVPEGVKSAASTAATTIGVGAQHIGDAIDKLPDLMVRAIPSAVMSDEVKHLLFTDFSNTFRSFFHTNILSMPFVFRQAGLVGGILLLTFVAVTSEYATEAYFGAKNQMKNAHKVVLYGDVPRMVWGDWYPMINLFYGITHLIGFIAFSSSNAVVLLGAMGMKGGGARALGLIMPSLIALPLVLMKNAHSQQPLAIMSNTLVLTSVIVMCVDFPYTPQPPIKLWANSPSEFFVALGVTVYAFTGIGSTIPVERVMTPQRYRKLLRVSVAISWALLMAFGLSGFLSYGNHTCSVMTVSLQSGPLRTTASALLFFASLMIIPQQTFPLCELSDRRVLGILRLTHYWDLKPNLLRISYLILSAFAAFIVPYYGLVLSISGSLGCGIVGLVVPAALDYVRRERLALRGGRTLHFWEYFVVFGLGFYGCVVVVIGVVSGSYQLWKSIQTSSSDSC